MTNLPEQPVELINQIPNTSKANRMPFIDPWFHEIRVQNHEDWAFGSLLKGPVELHFLYDLTYTDRAILSSMWLFFINLLIAEHQP